MSTVAHGWCIMFAHVGSSSRHTVYVSILAVLLLSVRLSVSLDIDQFYPFNINGDKHTEVEDDGGSGLINLSLNFPFFNTTDYQKLYVNNNGIISFLNKLNGFNPLNFSDTDYDEPNAVIAPFWADIDIQNVIAGNFSEKVVYRQTNDSVVLARATTDVLNYFVDQKNFSAELVFIVTWYNVGYYGAAGLGKKKRNTFQSVMITDGEQSYVIFNYNKTVWTTGANSGGDPETGLEGKPAVVGFHSGNGTYFEVEHSGFKEIINISRRSNLPEPVPGKYIFRVDGPTVNYLSCAASKKLVIKPSTISMLGAELIQVSGLCLNIEFSVYARIPEINQTFPCHVTKDLIAECVPPALFRTGELTFELIINGEVWKYSATLNSVNLLSVPVKLVRQNPDQWLVNTMVRVTWDEGAVPPKTKPTLEVLAYSKGRVKFELVGEKTVDAGQTSRNFKLLSEYSPYSSLVTRLCWEIHNSLYPVCIWSDVFPVRWKSQNSDKSQEWCERWLEVEKDLPRIAVKAPYCPCAQTIADNDVGHFHRDPSCDSGKTHASTNCLYNPYAHQCYRRNLKSATDNGETCCYRRDGQLMDIRDFSGAGTHQRYDYKAQEGDFSIVPFFSYFEEDLLPKLHCCQYSEKNCSGFWKYRNATSCTGYNPPSPAQAAGDPHIVTLDGKNYSFNGLGDFYLVRHNISSLVIQVRATQAIDDQGVLQNASVFSHVAVVMPSVSDTVEVRKNGVGADVLVNNRIIDVSTSQYRNISIITTDDGSYLIVLEPVSVSVTIEVTPDLLNIIVLIGEESYRGNILGLLGNYNKNPDDDFIAHNGTLLPPSASMRDVHYDFGMTWLVPSEDSYLSADPSPLTLAAEQNFKPVFIGEIADDDLREGAKEICEGNVLCQFDYTVTGKETIAKATMRFTNKFEELKRDLDQIVIRCPFLEIPENGNRTVTGYTNGSVAEFFCDSGYELFPDSPTRYCQEDSTWSGSDVTCAIKTVKPQTSDKVLLYTMIIGGSVVLVLIVVVVGVYVKRRKPKPDNSSQSIELPNRDISVFENPYFMQSLQTLMKDGGFRIPRPHYVDPSIYVEYF